MASLSDVSLDRGLPASVEAERSILGAILLDNHSYNEAAERLRAEDFSLDSHRRIYARMAELIDGRHAVDIVTLSEELARRKEVEAVGGVAYLASLTEGLPRRPSIEEYVRIVKDKSLGRQLIGICSTAITRAADQSEEALTVLDAAESGLLEVSERGITRGFAGIPEIVRDSFGTIDNLYAQQKEVTGLATHYTQFDKMTSGLQASDLIIIAARPSMGKTAWAINIAENAAVRDGKVVAVFSLEMSKESLLRRMLASQALVSMQKIQTGFIPKADRGKLMEALERLAESKIFIDDTPAIALSEMRAKGRPGPDCDRLPAVDDRLDLGSGGSPLREPDARSFCHLAWAKSAGQGATSSGGCALPAQPRLGTTRRGQETDALRPARVGVDRAGCRCGGFYPPRQLLQQGRERRRRSRLQEQSGDHHRQAAQWAHGVGASGLPGGLHAL